MEKLHIVTPCSRPENLAKMCDSIDALRPLFDVAWWVIFDLAACDPVDVDDAITDAVYVPSSQWGAGQRNHALDRIEDGWVYFLDDDNLIHPNFFELKQLIADNPEKRAFAFAQKHVDGWVREVAPETMKVNHIDMAQVLIRRDLIGDERFPLPFYNADGRFIQAIYDRSPDEWLLVNKVMCYYNALR